MTSPENDARAIELEIEVPGTPEQVWQAIATGPGITAWFVPAKVDQREGGVITTYHGPGMEAPGIVTAWDPPRRLVYEEELQPPAVLATEFLVEARSGGTCVVRLVSSLFGGGADWDRELESMKEGWGRYLHNLRLYRTHFPGGQCSTIMVTGSAPGTQHAAWVALTSALGLEDAAEGDSAQTGADAPELAGVVERVGSRWSSRTRGTNGSRRPSTPTCSATRRPRSPRGRNRRGGRGWPTTSRSPRQRRRRARRRADRLTRRRA
jgi:uncharacterized protein YndB with AHSA1/START domain